MEKIIIAAIGENGELGKDNQLLWNIPNDLKRFKELTSGHTVFMGRKTYESIGRPLPNRNNLVLSRNLTARDNDEEKKLFCFNNYFNAVTFAESYLEAEKLFIIGGGYLYVDLIKGCDTLYITRVHSSFDADTFFPVQAIHDYFELVDSEPHTQLLGRYDYTFETYKRKA